MGEKINHLDFYEKFLYLFYVDMIFLAAGNPFISSYIQSDWFGKGVFLALFLVSAISWTLIVYKAWIFHHVRKFSHQFLTLFSESDPLNIQFPGVPKGQLLEVPHPFFEIYKAVKQKTLQIMGKNHFFSPNQEATLSDSDLALIEAGVHTAMAAQYKKLEKNLFILSTIVTLGPFLGLLGTVWGILLTFSELTSRGVASSNSSMLAGLAMALATTVIGLVVAIPALVGYNYLKNAGREYRRDMEDFSQLLMTTLELQYRKPDHAHETSIDS